MVVANYTSLLLTARELSDIRLQKKGLTGNSFQATENNDGFNSATGQPLVNKRVKTLRDEDEEYDFMMSYFEKLRGQNLEVKEAVEKASYKPDLGEGSSTRAMTDPGGDPVDILNQGDDVNIKINPKSNEGIENFYINLSMSESSNDSKKRRINKDGREYGGELMFGDARIMDYMRATGAAFEMDEFVDDPLLQKEVGLWHIKDIDNEIAKIKNIPVKFSNQNGLRAVAHLGGITGMKKFISSGGKYNKKDELGTDLMKYYIKFSSKVGDK